MCNMKVSRIAASAALFVVLCTTVAAQKVALIASSELQSSKTFFFVQRTKGHVKYSSADVFHRVVDDVNLYLQAHRIALARDEFGERSHAESEMALNAVLGIARDSGAKYLLYLIVDRPFSKWIKVTVRAYDLSGKQLWQAESSNGGGLSGEHGLRVTLERLHSQLDKKIGQDGLPVMASTSKVVHETTPPTR